MDTDGVRSNYSKPSYLTVEQMHVVIFYCWGLGGSKFQDTKERGGLSDQCCLCDDWSEGQTKFVVSRGCWTRWYIPVFLGTNPISGLTGNG